MCPALTLSAHPRRQHPHRPGNLSERLLVVRLPLPSGFHPFKVESPTPTIPREPPHSAIHYWHILPRLPIKWEIQVYGPPRDPSQTRLKSCWRGELKGTAP